MGLSFSVPPGKAVPSSLQNIYKELKDDCACTAPKHGDLEKASTLLVLAVQYVKVIAGPHNRGHCSVLGCTCNVLTLQLVGAPVGCFGAGEGNTSKAG